MRAMRSPCGESVTLIGNYAVARPGILSGRARRTDERLSRQNVTSHCQHLGHVSTLTAPIWAERHRSRVARTIVSRIQQTLTLRAVATVD